MNQPIHMSFPAPAQPTLGDVALHAGVSRATVSLVCRSSPLVAEKTRSRVEASMVAVGYVYNRGAAALRSSRSGLVGLMFPDLSNPLFSEVVAGVEAALDGTGQRVFIAHSGESLSRQAELLRTMLEMRVDGLIISAATGTVPEALDGFHRSGIPVVQVLRRFDADRLDYAGTDNRPGVRKATEHLLALGHRRIAFLGSAQATSISQERCQGYGDALVAAGLRPDPAYLRACQPTLDDAAATAAQLAGLPLPPTAIVCFSDVIAFGATLGLHGCGLEPGRDLSVIGFDDIPWSRSWRPALTSMSIEPRKIGHDACILLRRRLADPAAGREDRISEAMLVTRASTGPPPG